MEIKDIQANQGRIEITASVISKEDPRSFEKNGNSGRVCKAVIKDDSGEVKLTLWNDDVDKVNVGDKIKVENGWCSEFQGEKQLSAGKFGKIEVLQKGQATVLTNDPQVLAQEQANLGMVNEEQLEEDLEEVASGNHNQENEESSSEEKLDIEEENITG